MLINPTLEFAPREHIDMLVEKYNANRTVLESLNTYYPIIDGAFYHLDSNLPSFIKDKVDEFPETSELGINSYGVCDEPNQVLTNKELLDSSRKFFVQFSEINKSNEPENGGWRWHKWGPYIGNQKPTTEYIFDEPIIEKVLIYNIYEILN